MLQAMFSGVSGLQVHQTRLSVTGNNIANLNTIGFKAGRVTFQDQLSQTLRASARPSNEIGGLNPSQVGLGVALGAVDTLQTQGNLQTTGKPTDLAIQGNGFFLVSSGSNVYYTRDGSFDLDSNGVLVNPANGVKLLGYLADEKGVIDESQPINAASVLKVPIGTLTSVSQTTFTQMEGNLNAGAALVSTYSNLIGNITATSTPPDIVINTTAYDALGNAHPIKFTLSNPANNTPVPGQRRWDITINVDGGDIPGSPHQIVFNMTTGAFISSTVPASVTVTGSGGAPDFNLSLNVSGLTNLSSGTVSYAAVTDGIGGAPPVWNTSLRVFDELGFAHLVQFTFTRRLVGTVPPPPGGATSRWDWVAKVNGAIVGQSGTTPPQLPLYFDSAGQLLNKTQQSITITPVNGAAPFDVKVDFGAITQLAGTSSVAATVQDGAAFGTLQTFSVSPEGLITGIFSNGQSRVLGRVAVATFTNPSGLEKMGQNLFRESGNSGLAQVGTPNTGGRGKITTGFVEMSNVDLSNEFTNLIITQRGFQANTRIITLVDDLLQDVINLKR
ncbi:MAG: flagellar hook protein FlgE [Chloroherpetonaceae bacterium]|nr:flagellar hook protein FlgE [Chthonomonadaceae bacterium]MDW8209194.1 flagellar hook protein FlgE [Chloroherpetonaceae bacterium]